MVQYNLITVLPVTDDEGQFTGESVPVYSCSRCGGLVCNKDIHAKFHQDLDKQKSSTEAALSSATRAERRLGRGLA